MNKGFFGLAFVNPKYAANFGMTLRSAAIYRANFIATIGKVRYKEDQVADTIKTHKHNSRRYISKCSNGRNNSTK